MILMATTMVPLGARGAYELRSPFFVNASLIFECDSVKSFDDLKETGYDAVSNIYAPVGLGRVDYDRDYQNDERIITLRNINDNTFYNVPTSFIVKYPVNETIPYNILVCSANLGPLPYDFDTSLLEIAVSDAISDYIGVRPFVSMSALKGGAVSVAEHESLVEIREAAIVNRETPYAKALRLQKIVDEQRTQIALLEEVIIVNGL